MEYFYSPFRKQYVKPNKDDSSCAFCSTKTMDKQAIYRVDGSLFENKHYRWIVNYFPKFEGHTMLVPKRHIVELAEETTDEVLARQELLLEAGSILKQKYPNCGIEYFIQTGDNSDSSIPHLHWHLVPASSADIFRSLEKLDRFYTTDPAKEKVVLFPKEITMDPDTLSAFLSSP